MSMVTGEPRKISIKSLYYLIIRNYAGTVWQGF